MSTQRIAAAMLGGPMRHWLLALLRYAVTREETDREAVLVVAEAIDRLGVARNQQASLEFFRRSSIQFCRAMVDTADPQRAAVIPRFLDHIDDQRLRRALRAAIEFRDEVGSQQTAAKSRLNDRQRELWKGLT